jgi:hypothetical protein
MLFIKQLKRQYCCLKNNELEKLTYSIPCTSNHFSTLSCSAWYLASKSLSIFLTRSTCRMGFNKGSNLNKIT